MTPGRHGGLARAPTDARLLAAAPIRDRRTVSDRRRILLGDAESQSLHALRVVLHGAGFEVDATRTAAEALTRGALRLPAAVIIELVLPDGTGVQVCRRLREWSAMPVIVLSAVCDEEVQVRAFEAGADDSRSHQEPTDRPPGARLEIDLAARVVRRDGDRLMYGPSAANRLGGHRIPSTVVGRR
jgi:PleD family two-component response regulator